MTQAVSPQMSPEPGWLQPQHPDLRLDQVHLRQRQEVHRHRLRDLALRLGGAGLGGGGGAGGDCSPTLGPWAAPPQGPAALGRTGPAVGGGWPRCRTSAGYAVGAGQDGGGHALHGGNEGLEAAATGAPSPMESPLPHGAPPRRSRRAEGRERLVGGRSTPEPNKCRPWMEKRSVPACRSCCSPRILPAAPSPPPRRRFSARDGAGMAQGGCWDPWVLPGPHPWGVGGLHPLLLLPQPLQIPQPQGRGQAGSWHFWGSQGTRGRLRALRIGAHQQPGPPHPRLSPLLPGSSPLAALGSVMWDSGCGGL